MKYALLITSLFMIGCASQKTVSTTAPVALVPVYEKSSASALVFDPPVMGNQPSLDLARDGRGPSAFVGFDQTTTIFSYTRTDDRQIIENQGRYERRAISESIGTRYR